MTRCPMAKIEFHINAFAYSNELFGNRIDHLSIYSIHLLTDLQLLPSLLV